MIAPIKQNIDLVAIVEGAGCKLKKQGNRYVGLCPFMDHDDRNPSFYIFPDNRFKCFGCRESGDSIDFVQKLNGLSFKDTLKHLEIEQGTITPEIKKDIQKVQDMGMT